MFLATPIITPIYIPRVVRISLITNKGKDRKKEKKMVNRGTEKKGGGGGGKKKKGGGGGESTAMGLKPMSSSLHTSEHYY